MLAVSNQDLGRWYAISLLLRFVLYNILNLLLKESIDFHVVSWSKCKLGGSSNIEVSQCYRDRITVARGEYTNAFTRNIADE